MDIADLVHPFLAETNLAERIYTWLEGKTKPKNI